MVQKINFPSTIYFLNQWLDVLQMFCRLVLALLFWFFGDFRCGALLFMVIHVIYKYKNR